MFSGVPRFLQIIASFNPLAYGIDGLRGILVDGTHFGLPLDLAVLSTVTVVLLVLGSYLFSKIQI